MSLKSASLGIRGAASLFILVLAPATLIKADPVFTPGGGATLTFDSDPAGANQHTSVFVDLQNPPPVAYQIDVNVPGASGGYAAGKGSLFAVTSPNVFGITAPLGTGVQQLNPTGVTDFSSASKLTLSWSATWTIEGTQFGPPTFGFGNVLLGGSIAAGAGSFVQFDFVGYFSGSVTRSPINFHYFNDAAGTSFSTDFHTIEATVPDHIPVGGTETLSGTVTFQALGIDGLSEIEFNQPFVTAPEPAPAACIATAGLGVLGLVYRRVKR